jgi:DNA topoisomerase I
MISFYTPKVCAKIARKASLRYVHDKLPGICRKKQGQKFVYYFPNGQRVQNTKVLTRIQSLAIPPGYKNVWICPYANGHIQATGRDEKNRKQYIYHQFWRQVRQEKKFTCMEQFGSSLPLIRAHVDEELKKPIQITKSQIICAIIYLLDTCYVRIGTPIYAKQNQSYGLTTLRKKHLVIKKKQAVLNFFGKSSQIWSVVLKDPRIIRILKKCESIPGYELFKYGGDNRRFNIITSQEVNGYLKSLTNYPFTAKDFRTWAACRETLWRLVSDSEKTTCAYSIKDAVKEVAQLLGHTPTICLKNYIHPEILQTWENNQLEKWRTKHQNKIRTMTQDELLLFWLQSKEKV